jgi:hypothetical protein
LLFFRTHVAPQLISFHILDLRCIQFGQGLPCHFLARPAHDGVVARAHQSLCGAQTHALGVMPQGALFETFIYPSVIRLTKGDLAGGAPVALMAMAAVTVLEYAGVLA